MNVLYIILSGVNEKQNIQKYSGYTSERQFDDYIDFLCERGLIEKIDNSYDITEKGINWLDKLDRASKENEKKHATKASKTSYKKRQKIKASSLYPTNSEHIHQQIIEDMIKSKVNGNINRLTFLQALEALGIEEPDITVNLLYNKFEENCSRYNTDVKHIVDEQLATDERSVLMYLEKELLLKSKAHIIELAEFGMEFRFFSWHPNQEGIHKILKSKDQRVNSNIYETLSDEYWKRRSTSS